MRIDKFLWCVRLFKTRSLATDAVKREQVKRGDRTLKPSAEVKARECIQLRVTPIWRTWVIVSLPDSRIGPKMVGEYLLETTPLEDLESLERVRKQRKLYRQAGKGRPSKRDRRDIDRFNTDPTGQP